MDRKRGLIRDIFLLQAVFLLFLFLGCGSSGSKDPKSVLNDDGGSSEIESFGGNWELYEHKNDCRGNSSARTKVVIVQNDDKATLAYDSATQAIECDVVQTELQCRGTMVFKNGERLEIEDATFWYDENRNLQGESTKWTRFGAENSGCDGTSEFSSISPDDTDTDTTIGTDTDTDEDGGIPSFDGVWAISEDPRGCPYVVAVANYISEIDLTGTPPTITTTGLVSGAPITFRCSIEANELRCYGRFTNTSGYLHVYDEYNLRLEDNDHLRGQARWTLYDNNNTYQSERCHGTATLTGTRQASADSAQQQP